jgi:DNA-binding NarL/FixJ family response regulator
MPIRIVVVDDHPMIRTGLAAIIATEPDLLLVGEAAHGAAAVERFRTLRPDVMLMDLSMPGLGGVEAIHVIMREQEAQGAEHPEDGPTAGPSPPTRVVVLTMYAGDEDIRQALEAGAVGYLLKDTPASQIIAALRAAARGDQTLPLDVASRLDAAAPRADLTARELEVLVLVARGQRNREIAAAIGRTEETVKIHVRSVLAKLGASTRTEAVAIATARGILHPE